MGGAHKTVNRGCEKTQSCFLTASIPVFRKGVKQSKGHTTPIPMKRREMASCSSCGSYLFVVVLIQIMTDADEEKPYGVVTGQWTAMSNGNIL